MRSIQCRLRWRLNEHTHPTDLLSQIISITSHGGKIEYNNSKEWIAYRRIDPRFPNNLLSDNKQR